MLDAIEKEYGKGTYDKLKERAKNPYIGLSIELKFIADEYRIKANELAKEKGKFWS